MFEFARRILGIEFLRKRFFKTEDEKFEMIDKDLKELSNFLTTLYGLFMKKTSQGSDGKEILKQQKSVIDACKKVSGRIEKNTQRYSHNIFREEEKESLLLVDQMEQLNINIELQIKNRQDSKTADQEKALIVKTSEYVKDLDEKIKKIIYKLVYVSSKEFGPEVERLLSKFPYVREVLERYNEEFEFRGSSPELQKEFVKTLVETINKIPPTMWGFTLARAVATSSINCSASSALLCMLLQPKLFGLPRVEYAAPALHAVVIVTFSDNTRYYCDARMNIFECLEGNIKQVVPIGPVRLYLLNHPTSRISYTAVPAMMLQHGISFTFLNNLSVLNGMATDALESAKIKTADPMLQEEIRQAELFVNQGYQNKLKQIAGSFEKELDEAMKKVATTKEFIEDEKNMNYAWKAFGELKKHVEQQPKSMIVIKSHIRQIEQYLLFEINNLVLPGNKTENDFLVSFRKKQEPLYKDNPESYKEMIRFICEYIRNQNW